MEKRITHYDRLGVSPNATPIEIRAAFKRLAQRHHPDRHQGSEEAAHVMSMLNVAYSTLMDPQSRQSYDTKLYQLQMLAQRKVFGHSDGSQTDGSKRAPQAKYEPIKSFEVKTSVKVLAVILLVVAWFILRK